MSNVLIGAPVRDRAWILPAYLQALYDLDYPRDKLGFCFILNDSTDASGEILRRFQAICERDGYRRCDIIEVNTGAEPDQRQDEVRQRTYRRLAELRNMLLDQVRDDEDYLFSVDTDVIVESDVLQKLLASGKDMCAAVIYNDTLYDLDYPHRYPNFMVATGEKDSSGNPLYVHYRQFPRGFRFPVDVTGAVCLISRQLCRAARYGYHRFGEDIYFCERAREAGYQPWVDGSCFAQHYMSPEAFLMSRESFRAREQPDGNLLAVTIPYEGGSYVDIMLSPSMLRKIEQGLKLRDIGDVLCELKMVQPGAELLSFDIDQVGVATIRLRYKKDNDP